MEQNAVEGAAAQGHEDAKRRLEQVRKTQGDL